MFPVSWVQGKPTVMAAPTIHPLCGQDQTLLCVGLYHPGAFHFWTVVLSAVQFCQYLWSFRYGDAKKEMHTAFFSWSSSYSGEGRSTNQLGIGVQPRAED